MPGWLRFGAQPVKSPASDPPNVEKEILTRQMSALQQELDLVKQRLDQLTTEKGTEQ